MTPFGFYDSERRLHTKLFVRFAYMLLNILDNPSSVNRSMISSLRHQSPVVISNKSLSSLIPLQLAFYRQVIDVVADGYTSVRTAHLSN
jgi:hypothetical protein